VRVQRHVQQRQLELLRFRPHRPEPVRQVEVQPDVARQRRPEEIRRHAAQPRGRFDRLRPGRQLPREGEEVARRPGALRRGLADAPQHGPQAPVPGGRQPLGGPDAAQHDLGEVAEVVRDAARELPEGF
jgi:hypothetical protein